MIVYCDCLLWLSAVAVCFDCKPQQGHGGGHPGTIEALARGTGHRQGACLCGCVATDGVLMVCRTIADKVCMCVCVCVCVLGRGAAGGWLTGLLHNHQGVFVGVCGLGYPMLQGTNASVVWQQVTSLAGGASWALVAVGCTALLLECSKQVMGRRLLQSCLSTVGPKLHGRKPYSPPPSHLVCRPSPQRRSVHLVTRWEAIKFSGWLLGGSLECVQSRPSLSPVSLTDARWPH